MADQYKVKAGEWDEIPWKMKLARDAYDAICAKVNISPDTRLADFGGGTGLLTLKLNYWLPRFLAIGFALSLVLPVPGFLRGLDDGQYILWLARLIWVVSVPVVFGVILLGLLLSVKKKKNADCDRQ